MEQGRFIFLRVSVQSISNNTIARFVAFASLSSLCWESFAHIKGMQNDGKQKAKHSLIHLENMPMNNCSLLIFLKRDPKWKYLLNSKA